MKVKTITMSEETHKLIKIYCAQNDIKINEWVEKELLDLIKKLT